ncbi:MAG: response regulator [Anaerolineae bacterium]|nr:response regulator [Anaerolineae bacterium]
MTRRVLIVDSDIGFILRLKKALEELDFDVRAMGRSRPALSALDEQRYSVAVVDLHLEHGDPAELILGMRVRQPDLPVIVSGSTPSDPDRVPALDVQGYIHKPYVARDLAQLIEHAIKQGYDFYSNLRNKANESSIRRDNVVPIETVVEAAMMQAIDPEPPIEEGATVGRVLELLQDPAVVAEILGGHEANESQQMLPTSPESAVSPLSNRTVESGKNMGLMAAAALRITENEAMPLDTVLMRIEQLSQQTGQPQIRPLPSWLKPRTKEERAYLGELLKGLHPTPTTVEELLEKTGERLQPIDPDLFEPKEYDTTPYLAVTQPILLPEFDLLPDPLTREEIEWLQGPSHDSGPINVELLEALAEAESDEDPRLYAVLSKTSTDSMKTVIDEAELVPTTLEDVTQAMVLSDQNPETTLPETELLRVDEAAVEEMLGEMDVIARAALQLTQLSLENSALGILLTHHDYPVGRTGNFSSDIWHEIVQAVLMAWHREGENNTRMRYLHLEGYGQCLLFSVRSVDDLTLTLVFSGDLPVRMIRKQVAQLTEALMLIPEKTTHTDEVHVPAPPEMVEQAATIIEEDVPTQHSRPTDLKAPAGLRDVKPSPNVREPGSYAGFACLWLLQAPNIRLVDYSEPLGYWLQKVASEQDWDFVDVMVGEFWVNVHIEIPVKAQPAEMMDILMGETNRYLLEALGQDPQVYGSVWASSYSITAPGRLLEPQAIERFIRYYSEQTMA